AFEFSDAVDVAALAADERPAGHELELLRDDEVTALELPAEVEQHVAGRNGATLQTPIGQVVAVIGDLVIPNLPIGGLWAVRRASRRQSRNRGGGPGRRGLDWHGSDRH